MNRRLQLLGLATLTLLLSLGSQAELAQSLTIAPNTSKPISLGAAKTGPALLWLQARVDAPETSAPGRYALRIALDKQTVTPSTVKVLNKDKILTHSVEKDDTIRPHAHPIFDQASGTWYLKADQDWEAYNNHPKPLSKLAGYQAHLGSALLSHHYEYLFHFDTITAGTHTLTLSANDSPIVVKRITLRPLAKPFVLFHHDWMQTIFPWQAPTAAACLSPPLRIQACAGESEPVTFGIYALEPLSAVSAHIGDLSASDSRSQIPAANIDILVARSRPWENRYRNTPAVPSDRAHQSPELLVPMAEGPFDIPSQENMRFYVDVRVPDNATPGRYRGTITLGSADRVLDDIPLVVDVLPFTLAPPKQKYWMWRQHWGDITKPANIACLRDIKAHGYHGLVRTGGVNFKVAMGADGNIQVGAGSYAKLAPILAEIGLEPRLSDTNVSQQMFRVIAEHLKIPLPNDDVTRDIPNLKACAELAYIQEQARSLPTAGQGRDSNQMLAIDDTDADLLEIEDPDKVATAQAENEAREIERRHSAYQQQFNHLAISGFQQVRDIAAELGINVQIFPVDEPCGTPWRREWTRCTAQLARQAQLRTWSTRNNFDWDAQIDDNAMGGAINEMYWHRDEIIVEPYSGELAIPALPLIGGFRRGSAYHFKGLIDEVHIYNRALTQEELRSQHQRPAEGGKLLYYSFDDTKSGAEQIRDESGNGHSGTLVRPATLAPGKHGQALRLNGEDEHILPKSENGNAIDLSRGWSISMWYRGQRSLFGQGYDFYHSDLGVRFNTSAEFRRWFAMKSNGSRHGWSHLTVTFDPKSKRVMGYVENSEVRNWIRHNVRWNYMQIRSTHARWPRHKTGVMSWFYGNTGACRNITTFSYDLNNTNGVAYPKGGDRFNPNGIWYRTMGWEGTREGIDDARYLQTLVETLKSRQALDEETAVARVRDLLSPLDGSYGALSLLAPHFGNHHNLRQRIIDEILRLQP